MSERERYQVSVIIPTYERPELVHDAINTALKQTFDNIEIIVVDDGSADPYTDEIAAEFPESVTCIRHEQNRGLSAARNTGIENASGKYIAFLDDDDRWHRSKIERQVEAMKSNADVGMVTCLVASITPDQEIIYCESTTPSGDCLDDLLTGNQVGTPSQALIRKTCIDDIGGFDESLPTKQDWDFYIRLTQSWEIEPVEDHLCFRTIHESMSSSPRSAMRDTEYILRKHEELIRRHHCWNQARANVIRRVGRKYLTRHEYRKARQKFMHALQLSPSLRTAILLLLSFMHHMIVDRLVNLKRWLSVRRSMYTSAEIFEF
jgi:glycosyltransferase involved in cell wall biosynthesis